MPDHLQHETSPYLIQHAENPVDWYPWGEEAFRHARDEDKPVFLSIGAPAIGAIGLSAASERASRFLIPRKCRTELIRPVFFVLQAYPQTGVMPFGNYKKLQSVAGT